MTEDGRDWGERCVDMYKIVDKVTMNLAAQGGGETFSYKEKKKTFLSLSDNFPKISFIFHNLANKPIKTN